jgi:hypothetical protein
MAAAGSACASPGSTWTDGRPAARAPGLRDHHRVAVNPDDRSRAGDSGSEINKIDTRAASDIEGRLARTQIKGSQHMIPQLVPLARGGDLSHVLDRVRPRGTLDQVHLTAGQKASACARLLTSVLRFSAIAWIGVPGSDSSAVNSQRSASSSVNPQSRSSVRVPGSPLTT